MFGKKAKQPKSNMIGSRDSLDSDYKGSLGNLDVDFSSNENLMGSQDLTSREVKAYSIRNVAKHFFQAHYLGKVDRISLIQSGQKRPEAQLVEKIEQTQLEGRLPLFGAEENAVRLFISRHGAQVYHKEKEDVLLRIPLHNLVQVVQYADGFNKFNLAVKVIVANNMFACHVFQCTTEDVAQTVCETLKRVFYTIMAQDGQ